jgi:hypothetical protein
MLLPRWSYPLALAIAVSFVAPVAFAPHDAHASVAITLTLPDMVEKSDAIVVGLPKSKVSKWEGGRIVTYTTVAIDTSVAGTPKAGSSVVVRTLGGVVDGIGQIAHGEAVLPMDKPIMLFLRPSLADKTSLSVVGMAQGALPVEIGSDKIARVVARPVDIVLTPKPGETKTEPAMITLSGKALPDAIKDVRTIWIARGKK